MKVLLTGANGFVGSHILDQLRADRAPVRLLLRESSDTGFIAAHLPCVEIAYGSITDARSLGPALEGVTHVIHCAGKTKALRADEYDTVNHHGTRLLVEAIDSRSSGIERLVFISSLAASRPAIAASPAREGDPPAPVTRYGRSKLAGELAVRESRVPFTILRPAAVYGPRDRDILVFVQWLRAWVRPRFGAERQQLSLVFVKDVAAATLRCLSRPEAAGRVYHLASPEVFAFGELAREIAGLLNRRNRALPLPVSALWLVCLAHEIIGRLTRKPRILSLQKYPELRAPGWVCDSSRLERELGFTASTPFRRGMAETLAWYRKEKWL